MARCPYLGMKEDSGTALDFPSEGNICYRAAAPGAVSPAYQASTCLTGQHTGCPVYAAAPGRRLPPALRAPAASPLTGTRRVALLGLPLILLLLTGLLAAARAYGWPERRPPAAHTESGAQGFTLLPGLQPDAPGRQLIPGTGGMLLPARCPIPSGWTAYIVLPTDSLVRLAVVFDVSVQELQTANCLGADDELTPGQVLYVPRAPTQAVTATSTRPAAPLPVIPPAPTETSPPPAPAPTGTPPPPAPTETLEPPAPTGTPPPPAPTETLGPPAPTDTPPPPAPTETLAPPAPTDTPLPTETLALPAPTDILTLPALTETLASPSDPTATDLPPADHSIDESN